MKKIFLLLSLIIFTLAFQAQSVSQQDSLSPEQKKSFEEIQLLNQKLVGLYQEKKFDDALTIGKDILVIAQKNELLKDLSTLIALGNVSEVYLAKGKESEAVNVLRIIAENYEKIANFNALEKTLSRIINISLQKDDLKNAEPSYVKLINVLEKNYGTKNKKVADISLQLANIYNSLKKPDKAEPYYLKAIEINDLVLNEKEKNERKDVDNYKCFCYHKFFQKGNISETKKALEELDKIRGISPEKLLNEGIINGKALDLVKPKYPEKAKEYRASGFAIVRVEIDEQGTIINAKTYCGFLEFVNEVEAAARQSKFSPTLKNGVPVKVTGDIVYNFTAR